MAPRPCLFDFDDPREFIRGWKDWQRLRGRRITWAALAKRAGLSASHLSNLLAYRRTLTADVARALARGMRLGPVETWQMERLGAREDRSAYGALHAIRAARKRHVANLLRFAARGDPSALATGTRAAPRALTETADQLRALSAGQLALHLCSPNEHRAEPLISSTTDTTLAEISAAVDRFLADVAALHQPHGELHVAGVTVTAMSGFVAPAGG